MTLPPQRIDMAVPCQDAANGPDTGHRRAGHGERRMDRLRAGFAQNATAQLAAQGEYLVFEGGRRPIRRRARALTMIGPIDAIEALPRRASDPVLDGAEAHMKLASHRALRGSATHPRDQRLVADLRRDF